MFWVYNVYIHCTYIGYYFSEWSACQMKRNPSALFKKKMGQYLTDCEQNQFHSDLEKWKYWKLHWEMKERDLNIENASFKVSSMCLAYVWAKSFQILLQRFPFLKARSGMGIKIRVCGVWADPLPLWWSQLGLGCMWRKALAKRWAAQSKTAWMLRVQGSQGAAGVSPGERDVHRLQCSSLTLCRLFCQWFEQQCQAAQASAGVKILPSPTPSQGLPDSPTAQELPQPHPECWWRVTLPLADVVSLPLGSKGLVVLQCRR